MTTDEFLPTWGELECTDSVYIKMMLESVYKFCTLSDYNSITGGAIIKSIELEDGRVINLEIRGEPVIKDWVGRKITEPSFYLEYVKRGRKGWLIYEQVPVMILWEENAKEGEFLGVFYDLQDVKDFISSI